MSAMALLSYLANHPDVIRWVAPGCSHFDVGHLDIPGAMLFGDTDGGVLFIPSPDLPGIFEMHYLFTNPARSVSSITSASGLVFTQRSQVNQATDYTQGQEVWTAPATAALAAEVITITLSGAIDNACIVAFGVNGVNTATPFDPHAGLPVTGSSATAVPSLTYSTTSSSGLVLGAASGAANGAAGSLPVGWTLIANPNNSGGIDFESLLVAYKTTSAPEVGQVWNTGGSSGHASTSAVDAFAAPGGGGGSAATVVFVIE